MYEVWKQRRKKHLLTSKNIRAELYLLMVGCLLDVKFSFLMFRLTLQSGDYRVWHYYMSLLGIVILMIKFFAIFEQAKFSPSKVA